MMQSTVDRIDNPSHYATMATVDRKSILSQYRDPALGRSLWQLLSSVILFGAMWTLMWVSLRYSYFLTLLLAFPAAGLLVRLFILQHDCGHGSLFKSKRLNDAVGFALGALVLTPYESWRRQHALHHATAGDLDRRGFGDVHILTVAEYRALTPFKRLAYRVHRNPIVLFGIAPVIYFAVTQRLTITLPPTWKKERASVHWTNLMMLGAVLAVSWLVGFQQFLLVHLPIMVISSSAGVWLFYVQHNFESTYWEHHDDWEFESAGIDGSSYYELPKSLQWFTANIGFHHIHHLDSRIPNYRLQECFEENAELQQGNRLTLRQSLACISLKLWDETEGKMVSFRDLRRRESA